MFKEACKTKMFCVLIIIAIQFTAFSVLGGDGKSADGGNAGYVSHKIEFVELKQTRYLLRESPEFYPCLISFKTNSEAESIETQGYASMITDSDDSSRMLFYTMTKETQERLGNFFFRYFNTQGREDVSKTTMFSGLRKDQEQALDYRLEYQQEADSSKRYQEQLIALTRQLKQYQESVECQNKSIKQAEERVKVVAVIGLFATASAGVAGYYLGKKRQ